ncbi:MAG: cytochrome c3 family protein [Proteobacteria bacterium]|nr:cytochrome c3 family protein [Pseudomonadota bacterium]
MKKILFFSLIILGLYFIISKANEVTAQTDPKQSTQDQVAPKVETPEELEEQYKKGLWNEGKAVFSDIKLLDFFWREKYKRGYQPEQPIHYSHKIHMEKNQMECQYCHSGVTKSAFATIPSVESCMGCHKAVKTDSPEIKKLKDFYDKNEPVTWVSVNNLPEHVRFNHKRHLKAGVTCQTCHGQVQKMDVVERMSSFKMGFCVSCHRENGASIDCMTCHY